MYLSDAKFFQFLAVLLLPAMLTACGGKKDAGAKAGHGGTPSLRAEGYVVAPQVYTSSYMASGTLLPNEQVEIHPEISGRVTAISFKEGTWVRKGQLLVQLYDADIKALVQKLRAQRELQVKILERQEKLLAIGGISRQDYETTETEISSIDADVAYQEAMLRKTRIVAPFDGVVGIRGISVGAVVSPETMVATLQQRHPLKMDFSIPDQYRGNLHPGGTVLFTVDGSIDTFSGKISAVDPGADAATRTVKVRALVPNPEGRLVPGAFAHVIIHFESDPNAILIPSQAVIPTTKDKKVAVVKNGKASINVIRTGERTETMIRVEQGLQPGDTIITTGIMQVKPGMQVQLTKVLFK